MTQMTLAQPKMRTPADHGITARIADMAHLVQGPRARLFLVLIAVTVLPLLGSVAWLLAGAGTGTIDPIPYTVAVGLVGLTWLICANHNMDMRAGRGAALHRTRHLEAALNAAEARLADMAGQCADLERQLNLDPLTGVNNRRGLEAAFDAHGAGTVMALLDIDHFKKINDTYGHAVGDRVLKDFARLLRVRLNDALPVYRVGGEEFVVFFPEAELETVAAFFDKFRRDLQLDTFTRTTDRVPVSFSAGLALRNHAGLGFSEMFKLADDRLYAAKTAGRARTVFAEDAPEEIHALAS
ncbi:GGDEF domain-containing protein [Oceaniglobus trochenteri]|uniref:GGDEF domain-containing protein n=1 Tax=Oceaniglobus trochenteri TaxID=2763260 RepID=UPI001D00042D|nr:GGDEF domain-containing protein [Oceaniglobus trochenteri]